MFKPLLHFTITSVIILCATPVFATTVTYQISATVPPHAMPATSMTAPEQTITNNVPLINGQQVVQQEQITRNDQTITVRTTVVL